MSDYLVKRIKSIKLSMNCDIFYISHIQETLFSLFLSQYILLIFHWAFIKNYSASEWHSGSQLHSDINYSDHSLFRHVRYIKRSPDSLSPRYQLICHSVNHSYTKHVLSAFVHTYDAPRQWAHAGKKRIASWNAN